MVWRWVENEDETEESEAGYIVNNDETLSTESDIDETEEFCTVTFKCIGVTRTPLYQASLSAACDLVKKGKRVPVKLVPEPTKQVDSRAISFQCEINGKGNFVGYVVKELCDNVHDALSTNSIVSTEFAWIKYKIIRTTGPGYYAAVDVTRKGAWSSTVKQSANTMY